MKTPYTHVSVPLVDSTKARTTNDDVVVIKGREKIQRPAAQRFTPTGHHGANDNQAELISGELRCVLTALSPLLVANQRVHVKDLKPESRAQFTRFANSVEKQMVSHVNKMPEQKPWQKKSKKKSHDDVKSLSREFVEKKQVLFPLQLGPGPESPVVIPGESLKGMVQNVIGSLSGAPLDRVDEAAFSARPNATFASPKVPLSTVPVAGRVVEFDADSLRLVVQLVTDIGDIEWVHGERLQRDGEKIAIGARLERGTNISGKTRSGVIPPQRLRRGQRNRFRWQDSWKNPGVSAKVPVDMRLLGVRFGLDEYAALCHAHNGRKPKSHSQVLVPESFLVAGNVTVDPAVVQQMLSTNRHVVSDKANGHLTERHPLAKKTRRARSHTAPRENDLLFLELLLPEAVPYEKAMSRLKQGQAKLDDCAVISCGQNYRYRWLHTDSVKQRAWGWDGKRMRREPRAEFDCWSPAGDGSVDALQNMFGWAAESKDSKASKNALPAASAGRISINYALEHLANGARPEDRFLQAQNGAPPYAVCLQPLAAPKGPSWAAGYLPGNQHAHPGAPLQTLGDGILHKKGGNGASELQIQNLASTPLGRKHYRHHKATLGSKALEESGRAHYDLQVFTAQRERAASDRLNLAFERRKPLLSDQASIAMRVSRPGTRFGFTLRFKDLHPDELGLLALALNPDLVETALGHIDPAKRAGVRSVVDANELISARTASESAQHKFALRLGHARPLGLGSVAINIDEALAWTDGAQSKQLDLLEFAVRAVGNSHLLPDAALAGTLTALALDCDAQSYLSRELVGNHKTQLQEASEVRGAHSRTSRESGFSRPCDAASK